MIPTPILLLLASAIPAFVLVSIAPQHAPSYGLTGAILSFIALNSMIWLIYTLAIYPNFVSPLRDLPTPKGAHPIIGHTMSQFRMPRGGDYHKFTQEVPNDGIIRLKGILHSDKILLTSTKAFAEVLVTKSYDFPKSEKGRAFLRSVIGDGLVVAEGAQHKLQRKHSLPSFAFRQIKELYPLFWSKAVQMTHAIDKQVFNQQRLVGDLKRPTGVTDIEYWAPKATLDIIGVAGLGRDFNSLEHSEDKIVRLYEELTSFTPAVRNLAMAYLILGERVAKVLLPRTAYNQIRTVQQLRHLCENFVQEKRVQISTEGDKSVDSLAQLIKANVFTDLELVDQLLTIIAAGHETTSSTLSWLVYLLSIHPDVQTRLRDEINSHFPSDFSASNADVGAILESMPLLNGVCNETLRVFPTVPLTVRVSAQQTTILGHVVPANTVVVMAPWAVHKDPAVWGPDAEQFRPERWIDPATGKPNMTGGAPTNFAFMTFIHGPRSCIGQNFARAELRALVAAFVGAYEFKLADPNKKVIPAGNITTKPQGGLDVVLTKVREW